MRSVCIRCGDDREVFLRRHMLVSSARRIFWVQAKACVFGLFLTSGLSNQRETSLENCQFAPQLIIV